MSDKTVEEIVELLSEYEESITDLCNWRDGMSLPFQAFFDKRAVAYETLRTAITALVEQRDQAVKQNAEMLDRKNAQLAETLTELKAVTEQRDILQDRVTELEKLRYDYR